MATADVTPAPSMASMFQVSVVNKKQEGNISAFWKSLNGDKEDALPKRYSDLKKKLVSTPEEERSLVEGWRSILASLKENNPKWAAKGVDNIPQVNYKDLIEGDNNSDAAKAIRECGNVVVKGAVMRRSRSRAQRNQQDFRTKL